MVDIFEPQTNDLINADLIAELVRRSKRGVSGYGVFETPDGWFVRRIRGSGGIGVIGQTVLLARNAGEFPDHLECRAIGSDPEEYTPILVAKPWFLRKTPWDGQTREQVRYVYDTEDSTKRTAYDINDSPGTPEEERNKRNELVSPLYLLGDQILAAPVSTDVMVGDVSLSLLDMTISRDWTVFYEQL